jgi:hypothetical protein
MIAGIGRAPVRLHPAKTALVLHHSSRNISKPGGSGLSGT